jgi:single-strand DNA-binding protein
MNTITVTGSLADPIEPLRTSPKGVPWLRFELDETSQWTNKVTGGKRRKVSRHRVVVRDRLAVNLAGSTVRAGDRLIVAGEVIETKGRTPTGVPYAGVEIVATDIGPSLRYTTVDTLTENRL